MIDIDEIRKRTEESMRKCFEKSKKLVDEIEVPSQGEEADSPDTDTAEALNASNDVFFRPKRRTCPLENG